MMKYSPDDFKDKLAGKQDKVAAVNEIKLRLATAGLDVAIKRRKLAGGVKIYFIITPPNPLADSGPWLDSVASVREFSQHTIQDHFPEASMTSGGSMGWTISEY